MELTHRNLSQLRKLSQFGTITSLLIVEKMKIENKKRYLDSPLKDDL